MIELIETLTALSLVDSAVLLLWSILFVVGGTFFAETALGALAKKG